MKMSYLRQHNRKGQNKRGLWIFLGSALILLVLVFYINPHILSNTAHSVFGPVWRLALNSNDTLSFYSSFLGSKEELARENKELEEELDLLKSVFMDKEIIKKENKELRESLNMKPREDAVLASVLAGPPRVPYDVLIINGGKDMGFSSGDKVLFGEVVLLGEIDEVYGSTSRVTLYSSPGMESDVHLDDGEGTVTAYGRGGGKFNLELSRNSEVNKGAYLLKTGDRLFLLGEVVDVTLPETGAVKLAIARVPVNIFSLRKVFVLPSDKI
ncbi:MAG: rod shape-determining protein MreC [Patescibacteria group bacterium]